MLKIVKGVSEMVDTHYIRQKNPKDLGHAIYCARTFVGNEPFAVLLGDDVVYNEGLPCLKQMMNVYYNYNASILGVQEVRMSDVSKYGIFEGLKLRDRIYKIKDLIEKSTQEKFLLILLFSAVILLILGFLIYWLIQNQAG